MTTARSRFALLLAAGCGASSLTPIDQPNTQPTEGHAFLTIVGNKNVFLDAGATETLTVKYADENGTPLAGEVQFSVKGTYADSALLAASAVTNSQGLATVDLAAGQDQAAFRIEAGALYAVPVDWAVAVQPAAPPLPPLGFDGSYSIDSQFNLVNGLPGTVGDIVNAIIDMTDSPNDPATWLIDLALQKIDNSTITSAVNAVRPALDSFANDALKKYAPSIVDDFITFGNTFGQVTKKFGVESQLVVTKDASGTYTATHTVTGVNFTISGTKYSYTLADLGISNVSAQNIAVTADPMTGDMTIADHSLGLSYGKVVVYALDHLVIPMIDGFASNLTDLLKDEVPCASISVDIANYVGIGDPSLYESACDTALDFAGAYVEGKISDLGGTASAFKIHGTTKGVDTNHDNSVDKLQDGLWEGVLDFTVTQSTLAKPDQKFVGTRM
jgi:hypothetical protein